MIKYKCIHCGVELETEDSLNGAQEPCPECKQMNSVPRSKVSVTSLKQAVRARLGDIVQELRASEEEAQRVRQAQIAQPKKDDAGMSNTESALGTIGGIYIVVGVIAALVLISVGADKKEPLYFALGAMAAASGILSATLLFAVKWILHYLRRIAKAVEGGEEKP
jgi:hypothetical protein